MTGDLAKDGASIGYFVEQGFELCIAQSFAKTMGLYGERCGALHIVCKNADIASKVRSQVKIVIRSNYSNPPKHGARIAALVLGDLNLRQ